MAVRFVNIQIQQDHNKFVLFNSTCAGPKPFQMGDQIGRVQLPFVTEFRLQPDEQIFIFVRPADFPELEGYVRYLHRRTGKKPSENLSQGRQGFVAD